MIFPQGLVLLELEHTGKHKRVAGFVVLLKCIVNLLLSLTFVYSLISSYIMKILIIIIYECLFYVKQGLDMIEVEYLSAIAFKTVWY